MGAWLAADVDPSALSSVAFERGWEPSWMSADLDAIAELDDPRVTITPDVPEYGAEARRLLSRPRGLALAPGTLSRETMIGSPVEPGRSRPNRSRVSMTWTSGRLSSGEDWPRVVAFGLLVGKDRRRHGRSAERHT